MANDSPLQRLPTDGQVPLAYQPVLLAQSAVRYQEKKMYALEQDNELKWWLYPMHVKNLLLFVRLRLQIAGGHRLWLTTRLVSLLRVMKAKILNQ